MPRQKTSFIKTSALFSLLLFFVFSLSLVRAGSLASERAALKAAQSAGLFCACAARSLQQALAHSRSLWRCPLFGWVRVFSSSLFGSLVRRVFVAVSYKNILPPNGMSKATLPHPCSRSDPILFILQGILCGQLTSKCACACTCGC